MQVMNTALSTFLLYFTLLTVLVDSFLSLFFFLWSGFASMIISSNSYVGSQFKWSFWEI